MKKKPIFDPESSFIELKIVRVTTAIILITTSIVTFTILKNGDYDFNFGAAGYNYFVAEFRVPLGILALTIPILAFLAANHRSEQTKAQIIESGKQNRFSNYFKHQEEFGKYLNTHGSLDALIPAPRKTYSKLFPKSALGDISIDEKLIESIESISKKLIEKINQFKTCHRGTQLDTIFDINDTCKELSDLVLINSYKFTSGNITKHKGNQILLPDSQLMHLFVMTRITAENVNEILSFDINYYPPKSLETLLKINTSKVPTYKIDSDTNAYPFDVFENVATG